MSGTRGTGTLQEQYSRHTKGSSKNGTSTEVSQNGLNFRTHQNLYATEKPNRNFHHRNFLVLQYFLLHLSNCYSNRVSSKTYAPLLVAPLLLMTIPIKLPTLIMAMYVYRAFVIVSLILQHHSPCHIY